ncbi:MAG: PAS domain S-box protein [Bacteroidota bacterium]
MTTGKQHTVGSASRDQSAAPRTAGSWDILEALPDMCFVVTQPGHIARANERALRLLGKKEADILDSEFSALLTPADHGPFLTSFSTCCADGTPHAFEANLVTAKGEMIAVELFLSRYTQGPLSSDSGCLIVARDISESKKKELDLLRFSNVAHYTVNPLEITDVNGRIIYVNPAFEKASGYSKEELVGKNPSIFGSGKHPRSFWEKMWSTLNAGKVWVGEIENRRRNGEPFFTHLLVSPILDASGKVNGYFGVHRDITKQKHLEQQLVHAQKMESIGLLAAGIAHEVGNPLTSISSLVQVIQRTTQDEFTHEKLELIKSQVNRISRIIRDLVDFSRRSNYEVQLTDINKSMREAVEIVRVGRKAKEITFDVQLDGTIPPLALVPDQVEQVFINILINAVDAIHARTDGQPYSPSMPVHGQIKVKTIVRDEEVVIVITDNGKGISEDALPKIFEPFYTTKKVGEGTGLGLWVSYGIIKSFQGNVKVGSVPGTGTTFTILLPLRSELS